MAWTEQNDRTTIVRQLERRDLRFAADLHAAALPDGFFPRLGTGFLRTYYESFASSPTGVALVAEVDGSPVGALVGTTDDAAHYRFVTRTSGWRLGFRALAALLARPRLLLWFTRHRAARYCRGAVRLVRSRRHPGGSPPAREHEIIGKLTHVAVLAERRSSGAGAALVERFTELATAAACDRLVVVTRAGPASKAAFYQRCGWERAGTATDLDGVPFDRLELNPSPPR